MPRDWGHLQLLVQSMRPDPARDSRRHAGLRGRKQSGRPRRRAAEQRDDEGPPPHVGVLLLPTVPRGWP